MNYLAHMFLSQNTPQSMLGNFLGDFVKGTCQGNFPVDVVMGIQNHRKVDRFTDANDVVASSKKLISKSRSRFAGIIIDVAYDHFLSINWNRFSSTSLDESIQLIYNNLRKHDVRISDAVSLIIEKMINEDWLHAYGTMGGIDNTFRRISKRIKKENNLWSAVEDVEACYSDLNAHFLLFFPQIIDNLRVSQ